MTNVLLIVMDALRAGNLPEWGYHRQTAPNISKICDASTVYRNAYAPFNFTTPSIATILTGEYYFNNGIWRLYYPEYKEDLAATASLLGQPYWKWKLQVPSLATKLKATHKTIMINEVFVDLMDQGGVLWKDFDVAPSNYSGAKGQKIHPKCNIPVHPSAEQTTDAALNEMWEAMDEGKDFFMYVHYWDTHWPPSAPIKYIDELYDGTNPMPLQRMFEGKTTPDSRRLEFEQIEARTDKRDLNYMIAWYDAAIKYMDEQIGKLIDECPDDTLIVFTADHAESIGEHNGIYFGHLESWLYEEVLKVPLIVRFPSESGDAYRRTIYDRVENRKVHNIIENYILKGSNNDPIKSDYIYAASKPSQDFTPNLDVLIKDNLKLFIYDAGKEMMGINLKDDPKELNPFYLTSEFIEHPEFKSLYVILKEIMAKELPKPDGAV